jgi:hypothetical protein
MIDYQEDQVVAFAKDCDALLRPDSGRVGVNCARMQWDACNGMGYEKSRAKHLAELQAEVGPHPPPPPHGDFKPAPRYWKGNMCGVRVAGLSPVDGGAADASLVLSWFYDRYSAAERNAITRAWEKRGLTHVLLSWPDSRDAGASPLSFLSTCLELIDNGFFPCVMLCSKDHDPADVEAIVTGLQSLLPLLVGVVPMFCIGWELSLWLSPTQVQSLIDTLAPRCFAQPGTLALRPLSGRLPVLSARRAAPSRISGTPTSANSRACSTKRNSVRPTRNFSTASKTVSNALAAAGGW